MKNEITKIDYVKFAGQVVFQSTAKIAASLAGLPIVAVGLFFVESPSEHPFYGYTEEIHTAKYINKGSSGMWNYMMLPDWAIMKPFRNHNYGLLGEHNGKWSWKRKGKERGKWSMWLQAAIRNPSNGFRYMERFSAQSDNMDIVYTGDYGPLQVQPTLVPGRNFVKAVDKTTGKTYYAFQYVRAVGKNKGFRFRMGFKVEPSNIDRGDLPAGKERVTFTFRFNLKNIDQFA